ncbi:hypothetical protein ABT024_04950 [Streptomyces sp. NPDC002812]|uniref:hypothetical protein n=1 Tax=Streptomyces sp. NPDC002812 TaxID=3154434 RepID=UPI00331F624B
MSNDVYLHITNLPPASIEQLHAFVNGLPQATVTPDFGPTVEAAREFLIKATPDAAALVELAVVGNGKALGADFRAQRGDRLNGATTSVTRTVKFLIRKGIWPVDLPELLTPTSAGSEGWSKTHSYTLAPRALDAFRQALGGRPASAPEPATVALGRLAALYTRLGHSEDDAIDQAGDLLRAHTSELADLLRAHHHPAAAALLDDIEFDA